MRGNVFLQYHVLEVFIGLFLVQVTDSSLLILTVSKVVLVRFFSEVAALIVFQGQQPRV